MTTASSTSQSSFVPPRGMITASFGPHSEVVALKKITGSRGRSMPLSAAWSRIVQTDADDLARPADGRAEPFVTRDLGSGAALPRQPRAQAVDAIVGEEGLVVVAREPRRVEPAAVVEQDARAVPVPARRSE